MNRKYPGKSLCVFVLMLTTGVFSACNSTDLPNSSDSTAQSSALQEPTETNELVLSEESGAEISNFGTDITLTFGETIITATLDGSETSKAFIAQLPITLEMSRYADREYYASIEALPENGEFVNDFEDGDVTYYTVGKSLAIFFGNADNSNQGDLIRMGKITSDLNLFDAIEDYATVTISISESEDTMGNDDFSVFSNVEITGINLSELNKEQLSVLYQQAKYCQAMTDADTEVMAEMVPEDRTFTHMSGRQQTREEYFADIEDGSLRYFTIGIENPVVEIDVVYASVTYTSVLNANAYGARGVYRMEGTHWYENKNGSWYSIDNPNK